ncbi:hypothetical protein CTAYLR_009876 [Chrysophaeum taylorii]|uniref:Uncharacterized protein n=1 Tax=Chrysophaeum taylorii TaxID=2483200 RepID=A0AAD7XQI2_9STRA|nr:hypothetical protein CTAYLR_009876 [Chrysophaeum taylorii]
MASSIDALVKKLEALDGDKLEANAAQKKMAVAMELVRAHEALELWRRATKYADVAIEADSLCIAAHLAKARALEKLAATNPKMGSRAKSAARAGLAACDRVVALEGLGRLRSELRAIAARERPGASAWNVKDTWEERDVTNWAVERLAARLLLEPGRVFDVEGHAQIVWFQHKARYVFDFESVSIEWSAGGTTRLRDVTNAADIEIYGEHVDKLDAFKEAVAKFEEDFTNLANDLDIRKAAAMPRSSLLRRQEAELRKDDDKPALDDFRNKNPNCKVIL